jgi:uncharacterized membrane protein
MKKASRWNFWSIGGKIMMVFVLAAMIGSMDVAPAFARDNHGRGGGHDGDRGRGYDRGRYDHRGRGYYRGGYRHGRRVYRSYGYGYGYGERIYVPPPVIYEPPPPPGIGIFFPPIIIHP